MFSWFISLWLFIALSCTLVGAILTQRRMNSMAPALSEHRYCSRCQTLLEPGASFCGNCGHHLNANTEQEEYQHV